MDLLYILLIVGLVICFLLALCICCFANSRYCHCVDYVYMDEDSEPVKTKTATSTRELSRNEYYSNSTPILGSAKSTQQSDFTYNGHQYSPLSTQSSPSTQIDGETTKTTFYTSPNSHSSVSETSYSTSKPLYPSDPFRQEVTYSETRSPPSKNKSSYSTEISYSSERIAPYQITTNPTYNAAQSPPRSTYSEDVTYRTQTPQYALRKSSSQTSLYENN